MIVIPDWSDAKRAVETGKATALDEFIFNNEPAGIEEETKFREQLEAVINYIVKIHCPQAVAVVGG